MNDKKTTLIMVMISKIYFIKALINYKIIQIEYDIRRNIDEKKFWKFT